MNLYLLNNQTNYIYPTLSELVTISDPVFFIFSFKSQTTGEVINFSSPNISTATTRYDMFRVTLTGSSYQDLTNGYITMNPAGKWTYKAYQATGNTINDIVGNPLEIGYIQLYGDLNTFNILYTGQNDNYNYYTGQND